METEEVTATEEAAEVEETAEATTAEEETEETGEDAAAEPPKPKGVQKRIDELVKQREDERRRAERLEGMLEQILIKQQAKEEPPAEPKIQPTRPRPVRPSLEKYDYDEAKYNQALDAYDEQLVDWKWEQRQTEENRKKQQTAVQEKQHQVLQGIEGLKQRGAEKYPDFLNVAYVPQNFVDVFIGSETGADVAYYLGKNPAEIQRLAGLPPNMALVELGRIESKLTAPPPKTPTKAPPPVNPVGSSATAGAEPDPAKDPDGWRRWEQARVRKLGRLY
jgi:hypothetical protein